MVAFNPEFDTDVLNALMELAHMPGQCIKHPEFIENYPGSDYVMTPAMLSDEYDLVMSNPDNDFWDVYVVEEDEPCCVEIICPHGVEATDRQSFIQHWDDGEITIVMYKNDDELTAQGHISRS